jgi:hypothetical protein
MMNRQGFTSTALTMWPCKRQSVKYSADRLEGELTIHKMFQFHQVK